MAFNSNSSTNGFTFEVTESPITSTAPNGEVITLAGQKALFNDNTNALLSIRSDKYQVMPNTKLVELANLAADKFDLKIAQFPEFNGGKKVGIVFDRPEQPFKIGEWSIENRLVFINSHDGTKCLEIGSYDNLLRCSNQFKHIFVNMKLRHNADMWANIETLEAQILGYDEQLKTELLQIERFIGVPIDTQILKEAREMVFGAALTGGKVSTQTANKVARWDNSMAIETGKLGMDVFALFNGATHFTTHNFFDAKKTTELPFFNKAADINEKVFSFCKELVAA